ncbi:hypothetical protein T05_2775 [Trichinella murrelli]|uniref:Uncharacterized protein n=1 Tax=Trichinella murrelli TaxID=144512 RepID=A0A0V0SVW9_9BILA|nr:hypothetical protein T05_2775 [Trichinella murrelli]
MTVSVYPRPLENVPAEKFTDLTIRKPKRAMHRRNYTTITR